MKTRLLTAVIALPLLFVILFLLPAWVLAIFVSALSVIAVWELLYSTKLVCCVRLPIYVSLLAAFVPLWTCFKLDFPVLLAALFLLLFLVFVEAVFAFGKEKKIDMFQICACIFSGLIVPLMLSALVGLRMQDGGRFFVALPILISFVSDGGAYFVGVFFGKHKLVPALSPKKTVEGAVGGLVSTVVFTVLYGLVLRFTAGFEVSYPLLALYGLLGSLISQLGDLSFSLLKRGFAVKDFGRLIPGHGGILDRFDSVIFCAPAMQILLALIPALWLI